MEDWKAFYTRALNYLEALNINTDELNETKTGWKQLKMMFPRQRLADPPDTPGNWNHHPQTPEDPKTCARWALGRGGGGLLP